MHGYRTYVVLVVILLAFFVGSDFVAAIPTSNALASHPHRGRNNLAGDHTNALEPRNGPIVGNEHGQIEDIGQLEYEDDEYDTDDDYEDDDEDEFDPDEGINSDVPPNGTFSVYKYRPPPATPAVPKVRRLPVKKVKCFKFQAGINVTGALEEFIDWGRTYVVGQKNWHWAGMGGYGQFAIIWECNCSWRHYRPVHCWEFVEALRLLEAKCGHNQGGRVRLHGHREIGLGPVRKLQDATDHRPAKSLCKHKYCCDYHERRWLQCGRPHPLNAYYEGDSCRTEDRAQFGDGWG
ncbi:hypothetical protein F4777DRAFT_573279 [Nemania sp. FL0916]|nr:hypothetical protein F4777DRAFT_573279 [Nemania sp. FL0916]